MIELEHSPLGGSGAHRFINCAGSFLTQREQIENGEFEDVSSEYADLGTAAHELCAMAISTKTEPFNFVDQKFGRWHAGRVGEINLDAAQVYFNECMSILAHDDGCGKVLIEQTIALPDLHPLLRGTVDFGFWVPKHGLWLRDYKNGEGIGVGAVNNEQLLYYAFLMILAEPRIIQNCPMDFPVSLGIVQPNFYGIFEAPDVWETTLGHVLDWGNNVLLPRMNALTAQRDIGEDDFVPGGWCQFCPVLLDCPKMQRAFEEYTNASEDFITMLTNAELDHYYSQREYARRFMRTLETTVHARLVTGGAIPSAKLVEKKTARVWKPGGEAAVKAAFGAQAMAPASIKSPAAIEKLSTRGKELALEYAYKPDAAGLSVAPLSDPRPEAKPRTNATVFEGHGQTLEEAGW